jgi:hypothetical protein
VDPLRWSPGGPFEAANLIEFYLIQSGSKPQREIFGWHRQKQQVLLQKARMEYKITPSPWRIDPNTSPIREWMRECKQKSPSIFVLVD